MLFSEPKIPQSNDDRVGAGDKRRFSALQRAENSSIGDASIQLDDPVSFSALQRAENSSIRCCDTAEQTETAVSVLFSEPKIPQ